MHGEVVEVVYPDLKQRMAVHAQGEFVSASLRERGWYSQRDYTLFRALLRPGDTYIDVGAHIGLYALYAAHKVGAAGRVVALEPAPANFALLQKNISLNGLTNIEALQTAAGEVAGRERLNLSPQNSGDHYLAPASEGRESVEVEVVTLDKIIAERALNPRLIKIDVQGAEARALAGLRQTLAKEQPLIIVEFSPGLMRRLGDSPFEMFAFIEKYNFTPYLIHGDFDAGKLLEPISVQALLDFTAAHRQSDHGWDILLVPQARRALLQPLLLSL